MVAITGNVTRDLLGLDSFQEVDICGITMPITKHNYIVKDPAELADIIREAFYIANEGQKRSCSYRYTKGYHRRTYGL